MATALPTRYLRAPILNSPQHIFTRVGGTRFVATMVCGFASVVLLVKGYLTGDQYVDLGIWTIGAFIAGNATQNVAGFFANRRNNTNEQYGSNNHDQRQY